MDIKVGRNDPCPCGSGKKYKRCHLLIEKSSPAFRAKQAASLHELDEQLIHSMLKFARKRFGEAWKPAEEMAEMMEYEPDELQFFVPWSMYNDRMEGRPIVDWFLEERGRNLSDRERSWLEAQMRSWVSLWEAHQVEPGVGLSVRDLLTEEERYVNEVSGSEVIQKNHVFFGRVVDFNGVSVLCGVHSRILMPSQGDQVVQEVRHELLLGSSKVSIERLKQEGVDELMLDIWEEKVEEFYSGVGLPQLKNTEGDDLLITTDHFDFEPDHRTELLKRLAEIENTQIEENNDGKATVTFNRTGNSMHKSWDSTVIGQVEIAGKALKVVTNSIERADHLKSCLEETCKSIITYRIREHTDPAAFLQEMQGEEFNAPGIHTEEAAAVIREFKEKHYSDWLDQPIEALKGKTPREAVKDSAQRKEVDLLLKDFETHEESLPPAERFDFSILREQLGL